MTASRSGTFEALLRALGADPARFPDDVLLNDTDLSANVAAGALLKYVVPSAP